MLYLLALLDFNSGDTTNQVVGIKRRQL